MCLYFQETKYNVYSLIINNNIFLKYKILKSNKNTNLKII